MILLFEHATHPFENVYLQGGSIHLMVSSKYPQTGSKIARHISGLSSGHRFPMMSSSSHFPSTNWKISSFLQAKQLLSKVCVQGGFRQLMLFLNYPHTGCKISGHISGLYLGQDFYPFITHSPSVVKVVPEF